MLFFPAVSLTFHPSQPMMDLNIGPEVTPSTV
jgi:hypothetical protein